MVIIELGKGDINIANWIENGKIKEAIFDYEMAQEALLDDLGSGEISCIIYGIKADCAIATDDGRARKVIRDVYKHEKLTGTVGLLSELIHEKLITRQYAEQLLDEMIEKGFWYRRDIPFWQNE
jgi:predicted nucleic acid-binding protein